MSYLLTINREKQKNGGKKPQKRDIYQKTVDNSIVKKHLKTCLFGRKSSSVAKSRN